MPDNLTGAFDAAVARQKTTAGTVSPAGGSMADAAAADEGPWRGLLEGIPAAVYTTDAAGRVTFYNQAAADLAGRQPQLGEDLWCVTWRLYNPDGTRLPHEHCPMAVALKENRAIRGREAIAERPDGTRVPILPFPTPLRDANGELVGAINMLVDISERKAAEEALRTSEERYRRLNETLEARVAERTEELIAANRRLRAEAAERERAEAALHQAQKMEAVGQLASGMAHDFNNLLTAILGNLELIETRVADPALRRMVQAACRAALRGAQLNEQMLAFSRKQYLAPRAVDLNALVGEMTDLLRRTLGGTVEVTTALSPDLWPAVVDPTQIELVLLNLAINARDALPRGGTVRITTANVAADAMGRPEGLAAADYVCIAVADDGVGMSPSVLARACEPFFTTKEPGKGSGLGLSQAYGVARQSGGDIVIESATGRGTTVAVYLPRGKSMPLAEAGEGAAPPVAKRAPTILVVDDQADVREVAVAHLEALGYRAVEAVDGRSGLALIRADDRIDLLIADYAMAGMSGLELAQAARAARPGLPIVIMTGYLDLTALDPQVPDAMLLKKPYRLAELADAVDQALRGRHRAERSAKIVPLHRA